MSFNHFPKLAAVIALLAIIALPMHSVSASPTKQVVNVQFVNHIQAGLPEQDVFIESSSATNQVIRVEGDAAKDASNLAKTVYSTEAATGHDPFKLGPSPLGPFPKGANLGFTMGQWLDATGSGSYTVNGGNAE